MKAADALADQQCTIARPSSFLGDRWTLVILRQAFNGVKRFEDFQSGLGISRSLLSDRLAALVEEGILRREPYKDEIRTRDRYRLTPKGADLYPVLMALKSWGDKYMADEGPFVITRHKGCGGETEIAVRCTACGEELSAYDVEASPGPGLAVS
jgi:DNA-binding HxlR family transcriptional regulator